jgi:adenylate cyclase class 2
MVEHEVKLAFDAFEAARSAVQTAGGRLVVVRRLQHDRLFDAAGDPLRAAGSTLRLRRDGARAIVTFKGPVLPGLVKSRQEIETDVGDADTFEALLGAVGFTVWFRYEKYREEYALDATRVAIDETPIGVYVEIEGDPDAIAAAASRLGRSRRDYILESYRGLWMMHRPDDARDMVFDRTPPADRP